MALYQYIGREYTKISLVEGEEKVKVVEGEIIESERDEKVFLTNGFQIVGEKNLSKKAKEDIFN